MVAQAFERGGASDQRPVEVGVADAPAGRASRRSGPAAAGIGDALGAVDELHIAQ